MQSIFVLWTNFQTENNEKTTLKKKEKENEAKSKQKKFRLLLSGYTITPIRLFVI